MISISLNGYWNMGSLPICTFCFFFFWISKFDWILWILQKTLCIRYLFFFLEYIYIYIIKSKLKHKKKKKKKKTKGSKWNHGEWGGPESKKYSYPPIPSFFFFFSMVSAKIEYVGTPLQNGPS